jgi:cysteinyl-tRNA synthetase
MGKSIMALSETVKESLRDAQEDLRNALACAARTEKPFVSKHIADMLAQIDNLIDATEMLEKMQNRKDGDSGFFGTFFNPDAQ